MTHDQIIKIVCEYYGIDKETILKKTRKREIVQARQIAMYFTKEFTRLSLANIGLYIGEKDHATVLHACKTVNNLIETSKSIRYDCEVIEQRIKNYGKKATTLMQLLEIWTKRTEKLSTINTYRGVCLHMEMYKRMVDILYWAKKLNIK